MAISAAKPYRRKTLLPVHLHYPPGSKTPHCPSCARELSNSNASYLLSSRSPAGAAESESARPAKKAKKEKKENQKEKDAAPYVCGHVVCKTCVDTIVKPAKRCCVCEAGVGEAGMIPVGKEGEAAFLFPLFSQASLFAPCRWTRQASVALLRFANKELRGNPERRSCSRPLRTD